MLCSVLQRVAVCLPALQRHVFQTLMAFAHEPQLQIVQIRLLNTQFFSLIQSMQIQNFHLNEPEPFMHTPNPPRSGYD